MIGRPLPQDETALSRSLRARPEVVLQPTDGLGCLASIEHQRVKVELDRVDRQDTRWRELGRL